MNRLADALLEHETLTKDDIVAACRGEKIQKLKLNLATESEDKDGSEEKIHEIVKTRGFTIFFNKE